MPLVKWTFLALLLLPAAELAVFILVAQAIGWLWALALCLATSFAGAILLRAARDGLTRFRAVLSDDGMRRVQLEGGGFGLLLAGFLLLLPGFITDILGLLLLVPAVRRAAAAAIAQAFRKRWGGAPQDAVVDLPPDQWRQVPDPALDHKPKP
jgi:UPF0716 protein FxsA